MLTLVRRARRRLFCNDLLSQGANAASAALIGFIVLLLLGTQVLNWQWALLLPLATVAVGVYLARRRLPSRYAIAQRIDARMALSDALSTALYFSENPSGNVDADVCRLQREKAETLAAGIDPRLAVPFSMPRTAYLMVALVLVASSLFALRYGLSRRLDLQQPLAAMLQQTFNFVARAEQPAATKRALPPQPNQDDNDAQQPSAEDQGQRSGDAQESPDDSSPEAKDGQGSKNQGKNADDGSKKDGQEGDQAESDPKDGQSGDEQKGSGDNGNSGQQGKNKQDQKDANAKQDANGSGDNSSLMSKVKDAMQNLLSKMKPQQQQGGQQQSAGEKNQQAGKGQQQQNGKQQAKDGQQQSQGQQGDAQEGQSGEQAQNSQDPQGKGAGKSDSHQASKQPGSGVGSQDGDKSIKQAEQLAAMGKISEIIGKRSANISGETTVEVQATSQQLKTPYAQRGAQHTQGGAEISRDEIPVALQTYVESYFEQVRKAPAVPAAVPAPAKK